MDAQNFKNIRKVLRIKTGETGLPFRVEFYAEHIQASQVNLCMHGRKFIF